MSYGNALDWLWHQLCKSDQSLSLSGLASEFVTITHLTCLQLSKLHKQVEDNQKTAVTGLSCSLVQNIDFVNRSLPITSQSFPQSPGTIYTCITKLRVVLPGGVMYWVWDCFNCKVSDYANKIDTVAINRMWMIFLIVALVLRYSSGSQIWSRIVL